MATTKFRLESILIEGFKAFTKPQTIEASAKPLQTETAAELDALMPSILSKAFSGNL